MIDLDELLRRSPGLTAIHVERWVARGLLRPSPDASPDWRFEPQDAVRLRLLADLNDDLGLDDDTVEMVVGLIDQVNTLRAQLSLLARAIAAQPADVREAIAVSLSRLDGA